MTRFPTLSVLEDICNTLEVHGYGKLFVGVHFVCVQHLLESTGSLIQCLIRLGARPADIFVLGKRYSSSVDVLHRLDSLGVQVKDSHRPNRWQEFGKTFDRDVRQLWERALRSTFKSPSRQVVVLDDGGHCILHTPKRLLAKVRVTSVEQTTSGLRKISNAPFPVVNVASSAAKKYIEAPLVADTILAKALIAVPELAIAADVGLIGFGSIGAALATVLAREGKRIFAYDSDQLSLAAVKRPVIACDSAAEVLRKANVVFGCTGENLSIQRLLPALGNKKVLISCTSEDREFNTLVQQYYRNNAKAFSEYEADIPLKYGPTEVRIIRGGFPINFDRTPESVPNNDIQVTRGLLLGAVAQAILCPSTTADTNNLDPFLQRFVLKSWFSANPEKRGKYEPELLQAFELTDWIEAESGALPVSCSRLQEIFGAGALQTHR